MSFFKQSKKYKSFSLHTTGKDKKEKKIKLCTRIRAGSLPGEHEVMFAAPDRSIYGQT
ncbi:hypothetical protein I8F73_04545 [Enterococcus faecalis]|nr:hypothetical protein [Enterococcus faecalis]